MRQPVSRTF